LAPAAFGTTRPRDFGITRPREFGITRPREFGITRPREGSVIALDPEIPPAAQRLVIEGAPGRWVLNGRPLGQGARLEWLPRPGRHVLERHEPGSRGAAEGGRVERVRFEVRPGQAVPSGRAGPAAALRG
jgi:penicillin-binding protein 1C